VERAKAQDSQQVIANSVAEDDSDAGACARGRPKDYRQAKGGPKGGLNSPENINLLICNIYLVKCGAPTRTSGQALFSKGSLSSTFHRASHVRTAEFTDVFQLLGLQTRSKSYLVAHAGYEGGCNLSLIIWRVPYV